MADVRIECSPGGGPGEVRMNVSLPDGSPGSMLTWMQATVYVENPGSKTGDDVLAEGTREAKRVLRELIDAYLASPESRP